MNLAEQRVTFSSLVQMQQPFKQPPSLIQRFSNGGMIISLARFLSLSRRYGFGTLSIRILLPELGGVARLEICQTFNRPERRSCIGGMDCQVIKPDRLLEISEREPGLTEIREY